VEITHGVPIKKAKFKDPISVCVSITRSKVPLPSDFLRNKQAGTVPLPMIIHIAIDGPL
jgi:hypothetical protein